MNENSYYNPFNMKEQCDEAIRNLQNDNEVLKTVEENLDEFINDEKINSKAFASLKQQISDYKSILHLMRSENDSDVEDFLELNKLECTEILDGSVILENKRAAEKEKESNENNAEIYSNKADTTYFIESSNYRSKANDYQYMAEISKQLYDKWQLKEDKYHEIDLSTCGLFRTSAEMRQLAQIALDSITGVFQDGTYVPDMNASWRKAVADSYIDRIMRVDENGNVIVNWREVERIMGKKASEITDEEYNALTLLYLNVNEDDLSKLLCYCMDWKEDVEMIGPFESMNKDYTEWNINKEKLVNFLFRVSNVSDQTLNILKSVDRNKDVELYTQIKEQRNTIIQRLTLLGVVKDIGTFRGKYQSSQPKILISKGVDDTLTLEYKEARNIGTEYAPFISNLEKAKVIISRTKNGDNVIREELKKAEIAFAGHFCNDYSEASVISNTSGFIFDEIGGDKIDKTINYISNYVTDSLQRPNLGKLIGYVPVVGDVLQFGSDMYHDKKESEENAKFISDTFDDIDIANIYSQFDCSANFVDYDSSDKLDTVFAYEGENTKERVDRVNENLNIHITMKNVITDPNLVWIRVHAKEKKDPVYEDRYEEAINDK